MDKPIQVSIKKVGKQLARYKLRLSTKLKLSTFQQNVNQCYFLTFTADF